MPSKWAKRRVSIPEDFNEEERALLGEKIQQFIRKRSEKGKGIGGKDFPGYTRAYVKSLDFRNAGKSASKVNVKLSGDMLAAIQTLSSQKGSLLYGFENGTEENDRADGNIRGTYGSNKPNPKKARDFLSVTKKELKVIIDSMDRDK